MTRAATREAPAKGRGRTPEPGARRVKKKEEEGEDVVKEEEMLGEEAKSEGDAKKSLDDVKGGEAAEKSGADNLEKETTVNAAQGRGRSSSLAEPTPGNIQEEGFIDAFYQPRSFSALVLLVALVVYVTIYNDFETDSTLGESNRIKSGILLAAASFLLYCAIQLRDSHLLRPHPAVWRVAHGAGLLYFLLLIFLLCQDYAGVQGFLALFDPNVGKHQKEKSYATDCRLYVEGAEDPWVNLKDQIIDRFVIAHFLGWTLKALILRDWGLMWVASVLFEVLEVSLQHMWPNFNECHWDHLFLDIFGCNLAGMVLGMYLVEFMGTHQFDWTGHRIDSIKGSVGKMKRVALQFTPYNFETYRWQIFSSWRRALIGVAVLFILLLGELNAFFLKSTFQIPIASNINLYRLSFWVLMTYMSIFEFHHFAAGKSRRIGVNSWLAGSLVSLETMLVVKHIYKERMFSYDDIWPSPYISRGWASTFILVGLTGLVKATRKALFWYSGAQEVVPGAASEGSAPATKPRTLSFDSLDTDVRPIVRASKALDSLFQLLTFAIPVPLMIVLAIDCYRTISEHPPPQPGKNGW